MLGFLAAMGIGNLIEAVVSRRWPALKSPPFFKQTRADVQPQWNARQTITSALFWLIFYGTMFAGLAATGSLLGGLVAPFLALFLVVAVAWVLTMIKKQLA
jgi:hypothetical protein